jgi:hypothetical protein
MTSTKKTPLPPSKKLNPKNPIQKLCTYKKKSQTPKKIAQLQTLTPATLTISHSP